MVTKFLSIAALAFMAAELSLAQTSSDCNPVEGDSCDPDPAFGDGLVSVDFTKGESDVFDLADGTSLDYDDSKGAVFSISSETDAPTIISKKYLFFGRVSCVVQAAPGQGIVTSFTLQSDDLDEIDWEWVGADTENSQSNYFGKGDTTTYDRGAYHTTSAVTTTFHNYTIDWTSEAVQWIIDGTTVRTLNYADAQDGDRFPQTPMQVRLGTWVGGSSTASEGTVEWAGGEADFSDAPFVGYYQSCEIQDSANGVSGAKEYVYSDTTGAYTSIEVVTSDGTDDSSDGGEDNSTATATTATTSKDTSSVTSSSVASDSAASDVSSDITATTSAAETETTLATATKSDDGGAATSTSNDTTGSQATDDAETVNGSGVASLRSSHAVLAAGALVLGALVL